MNKYRSLNALFNLGTDIVIVISFVHSFIHVCMHRFVHKFVCSFVHSPGNICLHGTRSSTLFGHFDTLLVSLSLSSFRLVYWSVDLPCSVSLFLSFRMCTYINMLAACNQMLLFFIQIFIDDMKCII